MEVTININQIDLTVVLDGDITPIVVDEQTMYPRNEYITFTPTVYKSSALFTNYTTDYSCVDADGADVPVTVSGNNVSLEVTSLGTHILTIIVTDTDDNISYSILYTIEVIDFIEINQTDCNEFTITNHSTGDVDIEVLDLFNTDDIGNPIEALPSQTVLAGASVVVEFEDVSMFTANVTYTFGNTRTENYIINNYCLIEECIASYALDILCAENAQCTECPDGIDLNRMMSLNYSYFMMANAEFGVNNFYDGYSHATLAAQFQDMKNIMDKLYAYCQRRNCTGLTGLTTNNVNVTTDCGCNG